MIAHYRRDLKSQLPVIVNNLDVDFTNDIRRAIPLAITSFYANAFPNQVVIRAHEIDTYSHDTGYIQYLVVSLMVVSIMLGGLLQAGANAAREYENGTIKELILSPARLWAIQLGKILGALVLNSISVLVVIIVIVFLIGVWPVHWDELLGFTLLLMIIFVALGTLVGTLVRRRQSVIPLSIGVTIPIFFLSGAFGPAIWGDPVIAFITQFQPVYYGIAIFQHAFHDFTTTQTGPLYDKIILIGFAVVAVLGSVIALRSDESRIISALIMITMAVAKSWLAILAIVRKDIGVWLRQPTAITATILPAIAFMIILYFGAQAVGRNPVALVVQDNGPHAQELVSILNNSNAFKVSLVTSKQGEAEQALKHIQVGSSHNYPC